MATRSDIFEIVNLIKKLPNSPVVTRDDLGETVTLFLAVLEDLPADMVKTATIHYLSEGNPFFPTPGTLRDKAMELQMLAMGIPTPGEAWGMVLNARVAVPAAFCETGATLRDACLSGENYGEAIHASREHERNCDICGYDEQVCSYGGFQEVYAHAAVTETIKRMGGYDAIMTGNPTADRARFMDGYKEVIARERTNMAMTPAVARFVEDRRAALDTGEQKQIDAQIQRLTAKVAQ